MTSTINVGVFSSAFNPGELANLMVWFDAARSNTITQDGSQRVSQWNDISGNANNVTQGTAGLKPLYVASAINSLPAIQFYDDVTAKLLAKTDNTTLDYTSLTGFVVFNRLTDLGANELITGKWNTTGTVREFNAGINSSDQFAFQTSPDGNTPLVAANVTGAVATSTNYIGDFGWNGSTAINAAKNNGTTATGVVTGLFAGNASFCIGSGANAGTPFAGYVGEIVIYKAVLTAAQRTQVLTYLSKKWSITIS